MNAGDYPFYPSEPDRPDEYPVTVPTWPGIDWLDWAVDQLLMDSVVDDDELAYEQLWLDQTGPLPFDPGGGLP